MKDFKQINDLAESILGRMPRRAMVIPGSEAYVRRPNLGEEYTKSLCPGVYHADSFLSEGVPSPITNKESDDIYVFDESFTEALRGKISSFWESGDKYHDAGFLHKGGILVWGKPGSGKTSLLRSESEWMVERGGIVLHSSYPGNLRAALESVRSYDSEIPIQVVIEDIDEVIKSWGEHYILEMMDGFDSVDRVLFIGTTNNKENLSSKMLRRGRFDEKIEIPFPSRKIRLEYLTKKFEELDRPTITKIANVTEGLSFADLRGVVLNHCCHGMSLSEAVEVLKKESSESTKTLDRNHVC